MRISELIAHLQSLQVEHGDLECETTFISCGRHALPAPTIAYRKILKGSERTPIFWCNLDEESRKGEKVVSL